MTMDFLSDFEINYSHNTSLKNDSQLSFGNNLHHGLFDQTMTSIFTNISTVDGIIDVNNTTTCAKKIKSVPKLLEKPKRALSAYNLFFQSERAKILSSTSQPSYKPRRSHGKIGFAALARIVAGKWKKLTPRDRAKFEAEAALEKERYEEEIETWNQMRIAKLAANIHNQSSVREEKNSTPPPLCLDDNNNWLSLENIAMKDRILFSYQNTENIKVHPFQQHDREQKRINFSNESYAKNFRKLENFYQDTSNTQSNIISILDCNPLNTIGPISYLTFNDILSNCDNECLDILSSLKTLR